MRSLAPCLAVMLAGLALIVAGGVAWAVDPGARGGEAVPVTQKAPPPPVGQGRGWIVGEGQATLAAKTFVPAGELMTTPSTGR